MTIRMTILAAACSVQLAPAQNPRPSTPANSNPNDDAVASSVASDGDLVAMAWNEAGSTDQVFVATADGRALTFGPQVRVDIDALTKTTQTDSVWVSGNNVYVVWEAGNELFFNRSIDGGVTFGTPVVLDDGGGSVRDWRVSMSPDPTGDHIYVAISAAIVDEDLFLVSSHDSGASFSAAVPVESSATGDVDALAVTSLGTTVHIAWDDNRSGRDSVYYRKSVDGGVTFTAPDLSLGDNVGVEDSQGPAHIAAFGPLVAVLWNEEPNGSGSEVIQINVSTDFGATFQGAMTIGNYTPGTDDTDFGHVAIHPGTLAILATWEDDRGGAGDRVYVATSTDLGVSFSETTLSSGGAERPWIVVADDQRSDAIVTWESTGFPRTVETRLSRDSGVTWQPTTTVSDNVGSVDFVTAGYNALYGNFVHSWGARNAATLEQFAGGFRPQTLDPVGWDAIRDPGSTTLRWDCTDFGADAVVFVLLSLGTGPTPLGDGRVLDLAPDFGPLIGDPLLTAFLVSGNGSTPSVPNPLAGTPAVGATLFYAGVGFSVAGPSWVTDADSFDI